MDYRPRIFSQLCVRLGKVGYSYRCGCTRDLRRPKWAGDDPFETILVIFPRYISDVNFGGDTQTKTPER
jgi:hypothetical protein